MTRSFLPMLVLVLLGLLTFVLARRMAKRRDQSYGSTCGRCNYCVRGLTTFICPECGSDLREVGIHAPSMDRGGLMAPGSLSQKVTSWSILLAVFGVLISSLIHGYCLPTVYSGHESYGLLAPASQQYRQVDFFSHGYHLDWPYRQPHRSLILDAVDVTLTANDGRTIVLQADVDDHGYQYTNAEGRHIQEAKGLDRKAVLDWMRSAGIDLTDPRIVAEADEIVRVVQDAKSFAMNSPRTSAFAGRAGGVHATYAGSPRIAKPIMLCLWIAVWLLGIWRIFRRHQEPHISIPLA